MDLHAEIIALQEKEDISYTAAARELYLVEIGKIESYDVAYKAFTSFGGRIDVLRGKDCK